MGEPTRTRKSPTDPIVVVPHLLSDPRICGRLPRTRQWDRVTAQSRLRRRPGCRHLHVWPRRRGASDGPTTEEPGDHARRGPLSFGEPLERPSPTSARVRTRPGQAGSRTLRRADRGGGSGGKACHSATVSAVLVVTRLRRWSAVQRPRARPACV